MQEVNKMFGIRLDHWRTMLEYHNTRIFNGRGIKYVLQFSVRYLYQNQSSMDLKGKVGAVSCNPGRGS